MALLCFRSQSCFPLRLQACDKDRNVKYPAGRVNKGGVRGKERKKNSSFILFKVSEIN